MSARSNDLSIGIAQPEKVMEDDTAIAHLEKPVSKMASDTPDVSKRFGAAKDIKLLADDWDISEGDDEIAAMFGIT